MAPEEAAMSRAACPLHLSRPFTSGSQASCCFLSAATHVRRHRSPQFVPSPPPSEAPLAFNCSLCLLSTFVAHAPRRDSCDCLCLGLGRRLVSCQHAWACMKHPTPATKSLLFTESRNWTCSRRRAHLNCSAELARLTAVLHQIGAQERVSGFVDVYQRAFPVCLSAPCTFHGWGGVQHQQVRLSKASRRLHALHMPQL